MTKAEQIRFLTAVICGPNILKNHSREATIEEAKKIARLIYCSVPEIDE